MNRFLLAGIIATVLGSTLSAQNETDALRYSRIGFGGTSRYSSMAGAFGALGGDLSVLSTNPAGIGIYRKNEITFTPSFYNNRITSTYNGMVSDDTRFNFRFDNFGFVFGGKTGNTEGAGWQSMALAISYNRLNSFQSNMIMAGDANTSMMDHWVKTSNGSSPSNLDPFNELLAWNTWLLDNVAGDSTRYRDTIPDGTLLYQQKTITTRGGMGEWIFGVGGNYSDKFYIGASVGIPQVKYEESSTYSEEAVNDTAQTFKYYDFQQTLETTGRGFNFKCGVIYRPIDLLRVGFAFHSPSILKLSDAYQSSMTALLGSDINADQSPAGSYNYTIRTPMRMIASVGVIIGKMGLVSVDYEFVDYSEARLKAADFAFIDANNAIRSKYTSAQNIRVGGELRFLPFTARGGFAWYGSPYSSGVDNTAARMYITGGIGYRDPDDQFFVDLGIVTTTEKSNYYFYDQSLVNPVANKSNVVNVLLSFGFRY